MNPAACAALVLLALLFAATRPMAWWLARNARTVDARYQPDELVDLIGLEQQQDPAGHAWFYAEIDKALQREGASRGR